MASILLRFRLSLLISAMATAITAGGEEPFIQFEGRQTHPVRISADGGKLFALNTPGHRLSVFDITGTPILTAEIPVGLEPVSIAERTADEVWIVNEVSDSVSIVSLSRGAVIGHLDVPDEPADVAFAGGKAFVSCARNRRIAVFDAVTREKLADIPIECLMPRALAIDPSGEKVYVAALHSGNRTTILPQHLAPEPPMPTNPALPPAPKTGLIVSDSNEMISYEVLDHDVCRIDVATLAVDGYYGGVGTTVFDLAFSPDGSSLWAANTEALNLIRFEPALRGHFVDSRVTRMDLSLTDPPNEVVPFDLNPDIDYSQLPNEAARSTSIAQPTAIAFEVDGVHFWVAGFGSDIIARVRAEDGQVVARVDVGPVLDEGEASRSSEKRGPRGLVFDSTGERLFVLNRIRNTLSVIDARAAKEVIELPVASHDPTPPDVKSGRGFLYDARLSGNGTVSCASCHIDAEHDGIAWDLGDPAGEMVYVEGENRVNHDFGGVDQVPKIETRALHPMKGPKVTQTLRGMTTEPERISDAQNPTGVSIRQPSFHWRGDRANLEEFNATFDKLMGGDRLPDADFALLVSYFKSLNVHPNPFRNLNRSVPTVIANGDPTKGRLNFLNHGLSHCAICHSLPSGTDHNIDELNNTSVVDFVKSPSLLQSYQKEGIFTPSRGRTLSGFGFGHDGTGAALPLPHFYFLSVMDVDQLIDTRAFILSFDSITRGTSPVVGHTVTVTAENSKDPELLETLETMAGNADPSRADVNQYWNDLVVTGVVDGERAAGRFDAESGSIVFDTVSVPPVMFEELLARLKSGDVLNFLGVPKGQGMRFGIDVNENGIPDGDELLPKLFIEKIHATDKIRVSWSRAEGDSLLEAAPGTGEFPWRPLNDAEYLFTPPALRAVEIPVSDGDARFIRLRRTW
ncbi:MAG: YncE family protein [Verrucomicrobiae bacterium]|nr:YncE family protein [Verrucomicrobiae bacterium]